MAAHSLRIFRWASVQRRGGPTCSGKCCPSFFNMSSDPTEPADVSPFEGSGPHLALSALLTLFLKRPATDDPGETDGSVADFCNISPPLVVPPRRRRTGGNRRAPV